MISVSVARSVRSPSVAPERIAAAARGDWPYRDDEDVAAMEQARDVVIAVGRGLVLGAWATSAMTVLRDDRRVSFDFTPAPDWVRPLVGRPAPEELTFSRGQRWPVKRCSTSVIMERLTHQEQRLTVRGHRLTVTAEGDLQVTPARGTKVVVLPPTGSPGPLVDQA